MANLQLTQAPIAKAEMLIRKPVAEVFAAFVDPETTSRFWFTKSTGRLETGKHIVWTWEMYGMSIEVDVKAVEPNKRILLEWGNYGSMTTVEWVFTPFENDTTYVTITNSGFQGDGDKVVKDALDSKGGFTWVLAGLKALLEHDLELNAIADAFPHARIQREKYQSEPTLRKPSALSLWESERRKNNVTNIDSSLTPFPGR